MIRPLRGYCRVILEEKTYIDDDGNTYLVRLWQDIHAGCEWAIEGLKYMETSEGDPVVIRDGLPKLLKDGEERLLISLREIVEANPPPPEYFEGDMEKPF